jgi:hypothetical protein
MMVLAFIIILLLGFHKEANADVTVEIGPTFLSGELSKSGALIVNQDYGKWRVGMGLTGAQRVVPRTEPETKVRQNLFVHGQRVVEIADNWDLGLGVAYFNARTRWNGTNFVASMSIEYGKTRWEHLRIRYRHFSNAGSASPNMGQDILLVGWRF